MLLFRASSSAFQEFAVHFWRTSYDTYDTEREMLQWLDIIRDIINESWSHFWSIVWYPRRIFYIINVAVSAIHVHQICIGKHLSKFADVVNFGRCWGVLFVSRLTRRPTLPSLVSPPERRAGVSESWFQILLPKNRIPTDLLHPSTCNLGQRWMRTFDKLS